MSDFFLPWQGEFGGLVTTFIRYVHTWNSPEKIVACPLDQRCLFPSATAYFHDYDEFLPDRKKRGRSKTPWVQERVQQLRERIVEKYPIYRRCNFIHPFMKLDCSKTPEIVKARFQPSINFQGLDVDVVITPRRRGYMRSKNLPFWQEIVDRLKSSGYSVGSVGEAATSWPLKRIDVKSWEHGGMEACIEMLTRAKLVIAQNTGTAHLAVFLDSPIVLMRNSEGMICWMETQRNPLTYFEIVPPTPDAAVAAAMSYLQSRPAVSRSHALP